MLTRWLIFPSRPTACATRSISRARRSFISIRPLTARAISPATPNSFSDRRVEKSPLRTARKTPSNSLAWAKSRAVASACRTPVAVADRDFLLLVFGSSSMAAVAAPASSLVRVAVFLAAGEVCFFIRLTRLSQKQEWSAGANLPSVSVWSQEVSGCAKYSDLLFRLPICTLEICIDCLWLPPKCL